MHEPNGPPVVITLDWHRKPPLGNTLTALSGPDTRATEGLLRAIGKARHWMQEIAGGGSFATIASREGKSARQIRLLATLAFVPPDTVKGMMDGTIRPPRISVLATHVPLVWPITRITQLQLPDPQE